MNTVYLDWNVMAAVKNGRLINIRPIIFDRQKYFIPYSTAHIGDIFSSYSENKEQRELIDSDIAFISELTRNKCLYIEDRNVVINDYDPRELLQQRIDQQYLTADLSLNGLLESLSKNEPYPGAGKEMLENMIPKNLEGDLKNLLNKPNMAEHLEKIFPGISANPTIAGLFEGFFKMYNNLNLGEGYKDLRKLVQSGTGINRDQIFNSKDPFRIIEEKRKAIPKTVSTNDDNKYLGPAWYEEITREYIELDMHGFQEDKVFANEEKKQTFNNTTQDSFHVAFASTCDTYITNDERQYQKAKKVYEKLVIKTLVLKPDEFLNISS